LILDEPTLFCRQKRPSFFYKNVEFKSMDHDLIFTSLKEVLRVSDDVTVFRKAKLFSPEKIGTNRDFLAPRWSAANSKNNVQKKVGNLFRSHRDRFAFLNGGREKLTGSVLSFPGEIVGLLVSKIKAIRTLFVHG